MTDQELDDALLNKRLEQARARKSAAPQDKSFFQDAKEAVQDFGTSLSNTPVGQVAGQIASYPGAAVASIGTDKPFEQARQEILAADRAQYEEAMKRSPTASTLGTMLGNIGTGPSGAGGAVANMGIDAGMAGAGSLAQGKSASDAGIDALIAGGLSGGAALGAKGVSWAADKLSPLTGSIANKAAVNALGGSPKEAGLLSERADEIGPLLREGGVIKFGRSKEGTSDAIDALRNQTGQRLGEARSLAEGQVNVGNLMANKWGQMVDNPGMTKGEETAFKAYMDEISNLPENISVERAQEILQPLYKNSTDLATASPTKQGLGELYQDLRASQKQVVESSLPPEWAAQYSKDAKSYALLGGAEKAADRQANQAAARETIGLKDILAGAGVAGGSYAASDDPLLAGGAVLGSALLRSRGASSAASIANNLDKVVKSAPHLLGKYGPMLQQAAARGGNALNSTSYLLQKQDPEYRKLINGETDEDSNMP